MLFSFSGGPVSAWTGQIPKTITDMKYLWQVLLLLLVGLAGLRFLTHDYIGGVVACVLLSLCSTIMADGMDEVPRFSLIFGVLCSLCFFLDAVPLFASLAGRSDFSVTSIGSSTHGNIKQEVFTNSLSTTPFFESKRGFVYNGGSVAMILGPFCTLLGACLGLHAYLELEFASASIALAIARIERSRGEDLEANSFETAIAEALSHTGSADIAIQRTLERSASGIRNHAGQPNPDVNNAIDDTAFPNRFQGKAQKLSDLHPDDILNEKCA